MHKKKKKICKNYLQRHLDGNNRRRTLNGPIFFVGLPLFFVVFDLPRLFSSSFSPPEIIKKTRSRFPERRNRTRRPHPRPPRTDTQLCRRLQDVFVYFCFRVRHSRFFFPRVPVLPANLPDRY